MKAVLLSCKNIGHLSKKRKQERIDWNRVEKKKGMRGNEWENKVKGDKRKKRKGKKTETSIRCFQKRGSGG